MTRQGRAGLLRLHVWDCRCRRWCQASPSCQIWMLLLQALVLSVPDPSQPFSGVAPTRDHPFIKELISRQGTCCQAAPAEGLKHGAAARLQLPDLQSCCLLGGHGRRMAV